MGWINRVFGREQKAYAGTWNDLFLRGQEYLFMPDSVTAPFSQVSTVYVAVDRIAESIGKIPIVMRQGETDLEKHPVHTLLHRGNEVLKGGQLLYLTVVHLMLSGEAFWVVDETAPSKGGTFPKSVITPDPTEMTPKLSNGRLAYWEMARNNTVVKLPVEDVVFFRLASPYSEIRGMAPLTAARLEINLDYKAARWNEIFYEKGARPPFYMYRPGDAAPLPPHRMAELKQQFEEENTGINNGMRIPFLPPGSELRPIGLSQKDMDFLLSRKMSREQILSVFGVPPAVAGVFEYANYANSAEQKRYFWSHTLRPLAGLIEDTIQADLIDRFAPGLEIMLDVDAALEKDIPEDYQQRILAAQQLWAMGVPFSDINEKMRLGFETDKYDWMDMGFLPAGVQSAEFALEPPPPPMLPPGVGGEEDPEEPPSDKSKAARGQITWRMYKQRLQGYELAMARRMQAVYNQAEKYTIERVKQFAAISKATGNDKTDGLLPPGFRQDVKAAAAPIIKKAVIEGGTSAIVEMGRDADFDSADPLVQAHVSRRQVMVEQTTETFSRRLNEVITKAMQDQAGEAEMKVAVEELFDAQNFHLRTISRTESSAAFNAGRFEGMQQVGVKRHMWLTAGDEKVRDTHAALDQAIAVLGTNDWERDGQTVVTSLHYPLDPTAPAAEVCNCRCVTVAVEEE